MAVRECCVAGRSRTQDAGTQTRGMNSKHSALFADSGKAYKTNNGLYNLTTMCMWDHWEISYSFWHWDSRFSGYCGLQGMYGLGLFQNIHYVLDWIMTCGIWRPMQLCGIFDQFCGMFRKASSVGSGTGVLAYKIIHVIPVLSNSSITGFNIDLCMLCK